MVKTVADVKLKQKTSHLAVIFLFEGSESL